MSECLCTDNSKQAHSNKKINRPIAERTRIKVTGHTLLAPLLFSPGTSSPCSGSSSCGFSSENRSSLPSQNDPFQKAILEPVGTQAVMQNASGLLQIRYAPERSSEKIPHLQYSDRSTKCPKRLSPFISLNGAVGNKAADVKNQITSKMAGDLIVGSRSSTSLEKQLSQMSPISCTPSQHKSPFIWSDLAKHTWNCWYGSNETCPYHHYNAVRLSLHVNLKECSLSNSIHMLLVHSIHIPLMTR